MRSLKTIAFLLLFTGFCVGQAPPTSIAQKQSTADVGAAKKVVAKALEHFGKTLDLTIVHRNLYVRNPAMRRLVMQSALKQVVNEKAVYELRGTALEQAFLAKENSEWLMWMYFYQEDANGDLVSREFDKFEKDIRRKIWPKLNKRQRVMYQRLLDESNKENTEENSGHLTSPSELFHWIRFMDVFNEALRTIIPRQLRKDFSRAMEIEAFSQSAGDIGGLKDRKSVYVSAEMKGIWGKYTFKLVKEKGKMRIFYFIIHDGPG